MEKGLERVMDSSLYFAVRLVGWLVGWLLYWARGGSGVEWSGVCFGEDECMCCSVIKEYVYPR